MFTLFMVILIMGAVMLLILGIGTNIQNKDLINSFMENNGVPTDNKTVILKENNGIQKQRGNPGIKGISSFLWIRRRL